MRWRSALLAAMSALMLNSASSTAAGSVRLSERGQLRLISRHGFTLYERGTASGTITGTIYVRLRIVSTSRVSAQVRIYRRDGSITGSGSALYSRGRSQARFSGTVNVTGGSGRYSHTRGWGLAFDGTIERANYAIAVHLAGTLQG